MCVCGWGGYSKPFLENYKEAPNAIPAFNVTQLFLHKITNMLDRTDLFYVLLYVLRLRMAWLKDKFLIFSVSNERILKPVITVIPRSWMKFRGDRPFSVLWNKL